MTIIAKYKQSVIEYGILCVCFVVLMLFSFVGVSSQTVNAQTESNATQTISLMPYLPYYHFVEYSYQGDQVSFQNCNMILEFSPDANGRFQIVSITDENQTAIVYQLTAYGLYELARFSDYIEVKDLRYDERANDGTTDLIFPTNVNIGMTYIGGEDGRSQFTVSDVLSSIDMNGVTYQSVVVIREQRGNEEFDNYFVPDNGLIAVEKVQPDGSRVTVLQQVNAGGYLE